MKKAAAICGVLTVVFIIATVFLRTKMDNAELNYEEVKGGCFVQNQNPWVTQQCPCKRKQLPLSHRKHIPSFVDFCLITVWQLSDKFLALRRPCRRDHLCVTRIWVSHTDIFFDRTWRMEAL